MTIPIIKGYVNIKNDYMNDNINKHECQYQCINEFNTNDCINVNASYYMFAKLLHSHHIAKTIFSKIDAS